METTIEKNNRKNILSTLWIFFLLNIIYADILNLIGAPAPTTAEAEELVATLASPEMLLLVAIFLEMAMIMVVLSRILTYTINRWANITIATLHTLGLVASLFVSTPTIFYLFFVGVEVTTLLFIVWYAWSWKNAS
jgi:hypothetical protein